MTHIEVQPAMRRWARERVGRDSGDVARRIPQLAAWERGDEQATLKQIETFARAMHLPLGYLFLNGFDFDERRENGLREEVDNERRGTG